MQKRLFDSEKFHPPTARREEASSAYRIGNRGDGGGGAGFVTTSAPSQTPSSVLCSLAVAIFLERLYQIRGNEDEGDSGNLYHLWKDSEREK